MKELKYLRKPREKHFLKKDGTFVAKIYNNDVHFLKEGKYEDIDNTITSCDNYFTNKNNFFHTKFAKRENEEIIDLQNKNYKLKIDLLNKNNINIKTLKNSISYNNIFDNIDLKYELLNNKVKEYIILKDKKYLPNEITFKIDTNLEVIKQDNLILLKDNNDIIYKIETPYYIDNNKKTNNNLDYILERKNNFYYLTIKLDKNYLQDENTIFPVIIDPTLYVNEQENVYDTYIYEGDTNVNRNNKDFLKIGTDCNNTYRALLKFDLPTIGTGSTVINAKVNLISHADDFLTNYEQEIIEVHELTKDWTETSANWNSMNNQYNSRIEDYFIGQRTNYYGLQINRFDITNLVKRWYADKENYGILLKKHDETYSSNHLVNMFYSKNHNESSDVTPYLEITYINQNGLENYLSYEEISLTDGDCYVNRYNGNMTSVFNLNDTTSNILPCSLSLIYNTNDVILENNYGYGISYKLNLHQELEEDPIDGKMYIRYLDADSTYHYFIEHENKYIDSDSIGLTLTKENDIYYITDKTGNKMKFVKVNTTWYLKEIIDTKNNKIEIIYDSSNKIIKVIDAENREINLTYEDNKIIISSDTKTSILNYNNGKITSIETKSGITTITYNEKNIISKVKDVSGKSINFNYYNPIPYKVEKMFEIGLDNKEGKSKTFKYGFNTTSVIDNKNRYKTYTFNNIGNEETITNLNENNNINDGYGFENGHFSAYGNFENDVLKNKPSHYISPIRYVKNYISNSSFEDENIIFDLSNTVLRSNETARTGNYSLKIINNNEISKKLSYESSALKGENYTFSLYTKNDCNMKIALSYIDLNNEKITKETNIKENTEFYRYDVTINYPSDALSNLNIDIILDNVGTCYIDDIQLEKGKVSNYHNLIDNSDFSNGLNNWNFKSCLNNDPNSTHVERGDTIISLDNNINALKIIGEPLYSKTLKKTFNISGGLGDTYNLSFWYKNEGINPSGGVESTNRFLIFFHYVDLETGRGAPMYDLVMHNDNWQFATTTFVAEKEYTSFDVIVLSGANANNLYVTNFSLFKDIESNSYIYDEKGNLIQIKNQDRTSSEMVYDNNNALLNMFTSSGSNFKFEYDNNIKNRVIQGLSGTGISNKIIYDEKGNPIRTIIKNVYFDKTNPNSKYYIRLKGTEKYLKLIKYTLLLEENSCSYDKWIFEKDENFYKIKSVKTNKYLSYSPYSNRLVMNDGPTLFNLLEISNGSYAFNIKDTDKYLYFKNENLSFKEITSTASLDDDNEIQFFIENSENEQYIESTAVHNPQTNNLINTTDSLSNKTYYNIDDVNKLLKDVTDSLNNKTSYEYDNKDKISKVTKEEIGINYTYNDNDLLSKIKTNNKEYNISYDEFFNTKEIKVGNTTLVSNNYENNNGNLISQVYGNGDVISYNYDEFDRLNKKIKSNETYTYNYDNFGNLGLVEGYNDVYKYNYDFARRLSSASFNNFKIDYDYDSSNNVSKKIYQLNDKKEINYTYNDDDLLLKLNFDDKEINYTYDYLGRRKEKSMGGFKTYYSYLNKGKRTSSICDEVKINEDTYKYKYDNMYNITHVYKNDVLINKYAYDKYYELIKEDNYLLNKTIRYTYDNDGNILSKKEYKINTYDLINTTNYYYEDNNLKDKLTKYNDEVITYDNIGNPITIGNKTLIFINGRELKSYVDNDNNLNVSYKYNKDGIRIEKIVNNEVIKYYVEQNKVILEERGNNMIYYIRDEKGNLEGMKYNNDLYYYIKNLQNDIIGLIDSNNNVVATYEYDSYGNITSIKDNLGNEITDKENIAIINPYRYRSYYYDTETNLYYLCSRYYNPVWGRFINADGYIKAGTNIFSNNMFAYCDNNPVNKYDVNGNFAISIGLGITTLIVGVTLLLSYQMAAPLISEIANSAVDAIAETVEIVNDNIAKKPKQDGEHTVYMLVSGSKTNPKKEYIGRTKNVDSAKARHHRNPDRANFRFEIIDDNLSYIEARGLEEALILKCKTLDKTNKAHNQIHGIRWDNQYYDLYMEAGMKRYYIDGIETKVGQYGC